MPTIEPIHRVAIIGTAGRDKSLATQALLNRYLWEALFVDAKNRLPGHAHLISGGAAWADHLAVRLFGEYEHASLMLHLPAPFDADDEQFFEGGHGTSGGAANWYHRAFSEKAEINSFAQLADVIGMDACYVTHEPVASGYAAMGRRNQRIADSLMAVSPDRDTESRTVRHLFAYTFGRSTSPDRGGTRDTWDKVIDAASRSGLKVYVNHVSIPLTVLGPQD